MMPARPRSRRARAALRPRHISSAVVPRPASPRRLGHALLPSASPASSGTHRRSADAVAGPIRATVRNCERSGPSDAPSRRPSRTRREPPRPEVTRVSRIGREPIKTAVGEAQWIRRPPPISADRRTRCGRHPGRTRAGTPSPTQNRRSASASGAPGHHPHHAQAGLYQGKAQGGLSRQRRERRRRRVQIRYRSHPTQHVTRRHPEAPNGTSARR